MGIEFNTRCQHSVVSVLCCLFLICSGNVLGNDRRVHYEKMLPGIKENSTKQLTLKTDSTQIQSNRNTKYDSHHVVTELRGSVSSSPTILEPIKTNRQHSKITTYLPIIQKASRKWGIDVSLILAVIHVESYFEPRARSHAPAFGLMQIMRTGAVAEISQRYFGNTAFTSEDLYRPDININIGTAYLRVLQSHYLNGIASPRSREWLSIAAYNCGPANLHKYFKRNNSVETFTHTVNQMSEAAIFNYLTSEFPISETRHYVKKVIDKQRRYEAFR
ncbi:transglycosylase SLT domain-containing protein [Vibrio sp. ZSDZ65]|uniref:Transglycosylase SLT domain-containing protein n=1 Tax=Vibrio qingdaonensis TaxID=2829491 RepID=A0A9X3CJH1_9VIBR|nr:transglycosylase SLT domain-containing protein [Vibrio qingdaonensis]MCW8344522.1 transglycosylase SLT domain-containing protein [Vibrio qingdaonensis]